MSRQPAVDAVVLDVGGVLMDWNPRHLFGKLIADEREREWFLAEVCSPQWNRRQDEGRDWAAAVDQAICDHPAYERWIETVAGLYDETVALRDALRGGGTPVYALTNFSAQKWALACRHCEPLNGFDGVVVSGEERVAKSDPKVYQVLLERYDLVPGRTFFTDDVQV